MLLVVALGDVVVRVGAALLCVRVECSLRMRIFWLGVQNMRRSVYADAAHRGHAGRERKKGKYRICCPCNDPPSSGTPLRVICLRRDGLRGSSGDGRNMADRSPADAAVSRSPSATACRDWWWPGVDSLPRCMMSRSSGICCVCALLQLKS